MSERMFSYEQALSVLNKRKSRKLANHTYLVQTSADEIVVRYHATDIITFRYGKSTILNTGGYFTYTTKDRMNRFSPAGIYSDRGIWYINGGSNRYVYSDNVIEVTHDGIPLGIEPDTGLEKKRKARFDRLVSKYINGYCDYWKGKEINNDTTAGDCFLCRLPAYQGSHVLSHMHEQYYVGFLTLRALERCGNPLLVLSMINHDLSKDETRQMKFYLQSYFKRNKHSLFQEYKNNGYKLQVEE